MYCAYWIKQLMTSFRLIAYLQGQISICLFGWFTGRIEFMLVDSNSRHLDYEADAQTTLPQPPWMYYSELNEWRPMMKHLRHCQYSTVSLESKFGEITLSGNAMLRQGRLIIPDYLWGKKIWEIWEKRIKVTKIGYFLFSTIAKVT